MVMTASLKERLWSVELEFVYTYVVLLSVMYKLDCQYDGVLAMYASFTTIFNLCDLHFGQPALLLFLFLFF